MSDTPRTDSLANKCELCGTPMPLGEQMFKYHGYSGPCPEPAPQSQPERSAYAKEYDKFHSSPCEQIRHAQEIEALKARIAELEAHNKLLRDTITDIFSGTQPAYDFAARMAGAALRRPAQSKCPHIISSGDGTNYCDLAQLSVDMLAAVEEERDDLKKRVDYYIDASIEAAEIAGYSVDISLQTFQQYLASLKKERDELKERLAEMHTAVGFTWLEPISGGMWGTCFGEQRPTPILVKNVQPIYIHTAQRSGKVKKND